MNEVRERVDVTGQTHRMAGRHKQFRDDELDAIRAVARQLVKEHGSQAAVAEKINIKQQNVGRFVAAGSTSGIDRSTGEAYARLAGYRDVEHLLLETGVLAEMRAVRPQSPGSDREVAIRVGRILGFPDDVIMAVVARHHDDGMSFGQPMRWWTERFSLESIDRAAQAAARLPPRSGEDRAGKPKPAEGDGDADDHQSERRKRVGHGHRAAR